MAFAYFKKWEILRVAWIFTQSGTLRQYSGQIQPEYV